MKLFLPDKGATTNDAGFDKSSKPVKVKDAQGQFMQVLHRDEKLFEMSQYFLNHPQRLGPIAYIDPYLYISRNQYRIETGGLIFYNKARVAIRFTSGI